MSALRPSIGQWRRPNDVKSKVEKRETLDRVGVFSWKNPSIQLQKIGRVTTVVVQLT